MRHLVGDVLYYIDRDPYRRDRGVRYYRLLLNIVSD